ncbi:hypothetical protein [Streptomyces sp. NPDC051677]|uniref:hypothetical protein n=1 Tax=Streptomyces sp. NPDC051677 TaxID=3365669 RepID=UPI0037D82CBF
MTGVSISGGVQHGNIAGGYQVVQVNATKTGDSPEVQALRDLVAVLREALPRESDPGTRQDFSDALAQVDDALAGSGPSDRPTFLRRLRTARVSLAQAIESHPTSAALLTDVLALVTGLVAGG